MDIFRVIVAGSRRFCNYEKLEQSLDKLLSAKEQTHQIEIISGAAQGPDTLGRAYAINKGHRISLMPAKWDEEGKSAGMKRNERMAAYADVAVVFYDGNSPGTTHMIKTMVSLGKPIRVILVDTITQELVKHMNAEEIHAVGR